MDQITRQFHELEAENAKLAAALSFYAEDENYRWSQVDDWKLEGPILSDGGAIAREALGLVSQQERKDG